MTSQHQRKTLSALVLLIVAAIVLTGCNTAQYDFCAKQFCAVQFCTVDFELFASYGIQTNSNPYGGRQRTPKSPQLLIILKLMC